MRYCPSCDQVLMLKFRDRTSKLEIDSCPECYGLWFDREELKMIFQSPGLSEQVLEEGASEHLLQPEKDVGTTRIQRGCPACTNQPLFPSKLGATWIDYCLTCHGIWLDRSELEQLVSAYRSGERGNLVILNQLTEGLGTLSNPNPAAQAFMETLERYTTSHIT